MPRIQFITDIAVCDYYPFGSDMPGRNSNPDNYRFGFNGQEADNEIKGTGNSLEFKYRIYDSRLGKFLSVDPLAPEYPWNSTYAFAENDVIRCIDLEGAEKQVAIDGTILNGPVDLKVYNAKLVQNNPELLSPMSIMGANYVIMKEKINQESYKQLTYEELLNYFVSHKEPKPQNNKVIEIESSVEFVAGAKLKTKVLGQGVQMEASASAPILESTITDKNAENSTYNNDWSVELGIGVGPIGISAEGNNVLQEAKGNAGPLTIGYTNGEQGVEASYTLVDISVGFIIGGSLTITIYPSTAGGSFSPSDNPAYIPPDNTYVAPSITK